MSKVGGYQTRVLGTLSSATAGVIAAAGDYAALDVMSNSATAAAGVAWNFNNIGKTEGASGWIVGLKATASAASMTTRLRLWLFHTTPTASELDDNAAFSLDADDRTKTVGYITLPALVDHGEVAYAQDFDIRVPFFCAVNDRDLYGILQTVDAETNEAASMTVTLELSVVQD